MKIIASEKRNASKQVALEPVLSPLHDVARRLPDGPVRVSLLVLYDEN
jgi:hypothetical protein